MLRATDLVFAYPGQTQPYCFTLDAAAGEVTAISGSSGSGKSTLLDLLAGFLKPQSGRLDLDGADLLIHPPETRPVSLLLQSDNLFEHLSAGENVALGIPKAQKRLNITQRAVDALAEVGLADFATKPASTLSGGQKQRVALARTLLRDKPVLLLDEPFSALDDETRSATRELVATLTKRRGWHTVLVSHHVDDIAALAQKHYRLSDGRLTLA